MNAERMRRRCVGGGYQLGGLGGEIEPQVFAVAQRGEADPMQYGGFVEIEIEDDGSGRTIEEIEAALTALTLEAKAADAMAGQTSKSSLGVRQRKTEHVYQTLRCAGEVTAESEETLTVLAESIQAKRHGAAVRPKELVAFVTNAFILAVTRRITTEKQSQGAGHPSLSI
jgi:hypothetical protein